MANPRYLTKSRFKLAAECPTKLYHTDKGKVYGNQNDEDSFLAMLAEGGYQVGELAKLYYPEGIEIESPNHAKAEALTMALLKRDKVVLFEPASRFGDLFARVDILVKDGNDYQLIEVKAKSYNSVSPEIDVARGGLTSDLRPYIEDVAFQAYVFGAAFPSARLKSFDDARQVSASVGEWFESTFQNVRDGKRSKVITSLQASAHLELFFSPLAFLGWREVCAHAGSLVLPGHCR